MNLTTIPFSAPMERIEYRDKSPPPNHELMVEDVVASEKNSNIFSLGRWILSSSASRDSFRYAIQLKDSTLCH
jgi:hypothetical protein